MSAKIPALLHLLRKNVNWIRGEDQTRESEQVKQTLKEVEILQSFDPMVEIVVTTDAYERGFGAVLYNKIAGK